MFLRELTLKDFRNFERVSMLFDKERPFTAFVGPNGHGKSTLLEAIYLLSLSKSFRTEKNTDLIRFEAEDAFVSGALSTRSEDLKLEVILMKEPARKGLKLNGVPKATADFAGRLKMVFFSPDDSGLIYLSPDLRRRALNAFLIQMDPAYLGVLLEFQKILRQRNALFRKIAEGGSKESELDFWDEAFSKTAVLIQKKRAEALTELSKNTAAFYGKISPKKEPVEIRYAPSGGFFASPAEFKSALLAKRVREKEAQVTLIGPHRDDYEFLLDGRSMASFSSRGELRSAVLALKLSELKILEITTKEKPLLLLDDVFSELDTARQKELFSLIKGAQTFLTTPHREFLGVLPESPQIFHVDKGRLLP